MSDREREIRQIVEQNIHLAGCEPYYDDVAHVLALLDAERARIATLETVLGDVITCAEEGSFGVDWEDCPHDCGCAICACRAVLKEPKS